MTNSSEEIVESKPIYEYLHDLSGPLPQLFSATSELFWFGLKNKNPPVSAAFWHLLVSSQQSTVWCGFLRQSPLDFIFSTFTFPREVQEQHQASGSQVYRKCLSLTHWLHTDLRKGLLNIPLSKADKIYHVETCYLQPWERETDCLRLAFNKPQRIGTKKR